MKIASIFTDGAVLQADMPIKIFGIGSGIAKVSFLGEEVEGFFEGEEWCLTLSSHQYGGPYELTVVLNGEENVFKDIYIGEVWIAAGQSNMEMPLFRTEGGFDEALHCHNDKIRFFTVPRRTQSDKPIYGWHFIKSDGQDTPWQICDKQSALSFSAIGYYAAKELNQKLDVCIGVISCNWGGRAIEPFIAKEYFESVPSLQSFMENYNQEKADIDYDEYLRAHSEALEKRKQTYDSIDYDEIEEVRIKGIRATTSGPYIHPLPKGPYNESSPSVLYESMFRRIMPFGARGMLWYQGESNGYYGYAEKYAAFMDSMRKGFENQDMKFYAVELASFGSIWSCDRQTTDDRFVEGENWAFLREQQQKATEQYANNYLVTTMELGDYLNIHPFNKRDVAHRLVLKLLKYSYGYEISADQPIYRSVEFSENRAVITLDNAQGLFITYPGEVKMYMSDDSHKLYRAQVEIRDDKIYLYSPEVKNPSIVRYAFDSYYIGAHIYNNAGLPLAPFRSDS